MVNGGVAHHQSGLCLFLLKGKNLSVKGIQVFQNVQIVLCILAGVECVFTEKHGKLRLGTDGWRQRLAVKLQAFPLFLGVHQAFQNAECKLLLLCQQRSLEAGKFISQFFLVLSCLLKSFHGDGGNQRVCFGDAASLRIF